MAVASPGGPEVAGHRLFAKYAHAPNALGYCGAQGAATLSSVASAGPPDPAVATLARSFSGAWPYQEVLAELTGHDDPLHVDVVRGYWTGNDLTDQVDRTRFGAALLERIRPQAGAYWAHLDEGLLAEAAPTHAFHVFSVYPWSRLLETGRPEPVQVLDSCRIGWGRVVSVEADHLIVRTRHLEYEDRVLALGPESEERVSHRIEGRSFVGDVAPGDVVAVHWGFACDLLTEPQADSLERWTRWQLAALAPRLAGG